MAPERPPGDGPARAGMRRRLVWTVVVAAVVSGVGLLSLGLPGFAILAAAAGPARLLGAAELGGDQVWPTALAIAILGPIVLVPVNFCVPLTVPRLARTLLVAAITLAANVVLCCAGLLVLPRS